VYNDKDDVRMIFDQMSADVCAAYEQAGRELATLGRIRPSTQRKANQEVVPLPFFSVLKHLRPIRKRVIAYLRDQPA